jgi:hypothetical protein
MWRRGLYSKFHLSVFNQTVMFSGKWHILRTALNLRLAKPHLLQPALRQIENVNQDQMKRVSYLAIVVASS